MADVSIPAGYVRDHGGYYKESDKSGPYTLNSAGTPVLMNAGAPAALGQALAAASVPVVLNSDEARLPASLGTKAAAASFPTTLDTEFKARFPAALGQGLAAASSPVVIASDQSTVKVRPDPNGPADSYVATTDIGWVSYATPTEMLRIRGHASKIIRVTNILIYMYSTSAAFMQLDYVKCSALSTGGTVVALTAVPVDPSSAAASAVVERYSVIPGALGASALLGCHQIYTAATTSNPGVSQLSSILPAYNPSAAFKAVTLRSADEALAIRNRSAAALPAGFTAQALIHWTEADA